MKQFVKALNRDGTCFRCLCSILPGMRKEKIKAGIFISPQIRHLVKDSHFASQITKKESTAWTAFMLIIKNFWGNY